jgi:DNA-binding NarL/FixJ family response regulator
MRTVLIIDDDEAIANIIKDAITDAVDGVVCSTVNDFSSAEAHIIELKPDAIVLDLMDGTQSTDLPGALTWQSVWKHRFCPIVIYTGSDAELVPAVPSAHPYVRRIQKGSGTESFVVEALQCFVPGLQIIRELHNEVDAVVQQVLRDTAGEGNIKFDEPSHLLHASRRRLAASMDLPTLISDRPLMSWEQYLVPPIGGSPLTGDLLKASKSDESDHASYRLVLTPSCDLVKGRHIDAVLVAKCLPVQRLLHIMSLSVKEHKLDKSVERLKSAALTPGVFNGFIALPEFPSRFPHLAANLKDLEILSYSAIVPGDGQSAGYDRVASIDSPFREQIAWAYLTTSARPGMPDRDLDSWAQSILKEASLEKSSESGSPPTGPSM